jgi:hypothetical protein
MYYLTRVIATANELQVGWAVVAPGNDPYAFMVNVNGLPFLLSMAAPPADLSGTVLEGAIYRPRSLSFSAGAVTQVIDFGWTEGAKVNMQYTRTPPAQ